MQTNLNDNDPLPILNKNYKCKCCGNKLLIHCGDNDCMHVHDSSEDDYSESDVISCDLMNGYCENCGIIYNFCDSCSCFLKFIGYHGYDDDFKCDYLFNLIECQL